MNRLHTLDVVSDWFAGLSYVLVMAWLQWAIVLRPFIQLIALPQGGYPC